MLKLFFSYSHKDEALRDTLEVHLATLKRQGLIQPWHDRRIEAGQEFAGVIDDNLKDADIILLLVSPFFLNSDYCYEIEMQEALLRHERQEAVVIPMILEPCDWKHAPFGKLLVLPKDGTPDQNTLTSMMLSWRLWNQSGDCHPFKRMARRVC